MKKYFLKAVVAGENAVVGYVRLSNQLGESICSTFSTLDDFGDSIVKKMSTLDSKINAEVEKMKREIQKPYRKYKPVTQEIYRPVKYLKSKFDTYAGRLRKGLFK